MRAQPFVVSVVLAAGCCVAAFAADTPKFTEQRRAIACPEVAQAPVIDGKLDDACWKQAEKAGPLFILSKAAFATQQTELRICRDKENLYLGVTCLENKSMIAFIRALAVGRDDPKIFGDDCVEAFFSPTRNHACSHFAVNPKGAFYDALNDDDRWQSGATVAARVAEDTWTVEMRIPLAAMAPVKEGDTWTFNVTRQIPHYEHPAERDFSTWAYIPGQGFLAPESFGVLRFKAPDDAYRKEARAYEEAARQYAAQLETAKQRDNVWTFNREGFDEKALNGRFIKRGWTMAKFWGDTAIGPYATRYNTLLMKTAFAQERLHKLERACFYLDTAKPQGTREATLIQPLRAEYEKVEQALNAAYLAYRAPFEAFRDRGVIESGKPFEDGCAALQDAVGLFSDRLGKGEATVADEVRNLADFPLPAHLGPMPRVIPAFTPDGKMNRLIIAGYGGDPFPKVDGEPRENEFEFGSIWNATDPTKETPDAIDFSHIRDYIELARKGGYRYFASLPFAYHWVTWCPTWFMQAHQNDTDIIFQSYDGLWPKHWYDSWYKVENDKVEITDRRRIASGGEISLNYHNPAVKELIRKEVPRFVSFYKEFPDVPFYLYGGETGVGFITSGGVRTTGYGPSARAAFQAWLKKKYGDIGELNRKWEATYAGFKGIVQPKDPELLRGAERPKYGVTPLMADFASFVMDAHIEYMKLIYQTIKANDPLRPVMSYFGPPFWKGQDYRARMMEVCDILEFHASSNPVTLMNLYAYSQQRLHPEKGLSYVETHWTYQDEIQRESDERAQRSALAKDIYRSTTWGRTFQRRWMVMCSELRCTWYLTSPLQDWTLLRYCAPAEIVAKRNCEQVDWMITHSAIEPSKILVIDPSASFRNGVDGITVMNWLHGFLYPRFVYEIYPEEYLLDGRVALDGYPVVVLPYAKYLPAGMSGKLAAWVKAGGTLIVLNASGIYTDLGLKDGALLSGLMGMTFEQQEAESRSASKELREQAVGKGKIVYVPSLVILKQAAVDQRLAALLRGTIVRNVWCESEKLELVLRKDEKGELYVCIMNPDPDKAIADTVIVPRKLQTAVDVIVPGGCPVKTAPYARDGITGTQFQVRLNPAEWTVIYAGKAQ